MKRKGMKTIITLLIIIGIIVLIQKYPEITILAIGIGLIILIGLWIVEADT